MYPLDKLAGSLGYEFFRVLDEIALQHFKLKKYIVAEASYQKALSHLFNNQKSDVNTIKKQNASIYHQLGRVAQEQREYQQAEQYYQHALQLYIEFNDRYSQASTNHQMGIVAQGQRQWQNAREYFLKALMIFVEYKDTYSGGVVLRSLASLWKASIDTRLPAVVASILGASVEDTEALLRERVEDG